MKRITIGGVAADLPKTPIAINWEYLNLSEPGKKYAPYTSTLTLPFTPRNKQLMAFADVVGGDPTTVRSIQNVDLWISYLRYIRGGTFKVLSSNKDGYQGTITGRNSYIEAIEGYTLDEIIADAASTFTYASYAAAIESLRAGIDVGVNPGFILPRTLEGAIASSVWTIYSGSNGHTHEVWLSAAAILNQMTTDPDVMTLQVLEAGTFVDLESSTLYSVLQKLYMPCWNWVLYDGGAAWTLELASGQRLLNGEVVDRADFKTFGGKSSWEFLKAIAQMFCCAIYQDAVDISLIPLSAITTAGAVDLSGKTRSERKYFSIPSLGSTNYIAYTGQDTLGRITITAPVKPVEEKTLVTLDLSLPGQLWVNLYSKNYFNTAEGREGAILLYDNDDTDYTTITHGTDTEVDILLKVLTYYDFTSFWAYYQLLSTEGIVYDAEIYIDAYTFTKLKPWLLVRINELGGLFYLNKISGFDPDNGKMAKCQVVRWAGITYGALPATLEFTYDGQTLAITVTSNIIWTAAVSNSDISIDKLFGTGNDTVTVTANVGLSISANVIFNFNGNIVTIPAVMVDLTLISVDVIGTQYSAAVFVPAPTFSASSYDTGTRRIFWAIYKGAVKVNNGYQDFTITAGTNDYSFTGLTTPAPLGTDYSFKVGYDGVTWNITSADFEIIETT